MAYYISQGRVETPNRRGGQFCCSFVANLLQYPYAKSYQNTMRFDKVIAKIERVQFLLHSVHLHTVSRSFVEIKKYVGVRL